MIGKLKNKYKNGTRADKNEVVCLLLVLIVAVSAVIGGIVYFSGLPKSIWGIWDTTPPDHVGIGILVATSKASVLFSFLFTVTLFARLSASTAIKCVIIAAIELKNKDTVRKKVFIVTTVLSIVCLAFDAFLLYNTAVPLYGSMIKAALKIR